MPKSAPSLARWYDTFAFDRASVRSYDVDGRLHVELTNISKANVCEYLGREIPNWQTLGLQPERKYKLYRDPNELKKAAASFNNIPVLSEHVPVTADDHQPRLVVGSTGTDAVFKPPFLKNSIVVWAKPAIRGVEDDSQKELSSAYRYRADMTPGVIDGEKYNGVMRDIIGNHVALVPEGRAGPDVVVGDAAPSKKETHQMSKAPRRATVSTLALFNAIRPKLAQDATLDDFHKLLDSAKAPPPGAPPAKDDADLDDGITVQNASPDLPPANPGLGVGEDEDGEGLSDEEEAQYQALAKRRKPAMDDDPDAAAIAPDPSTKDKNKPPVQKGSVGAPAMDAALEERILKRMRDATEAREFVRPFVGNLPIALDSAEQILRAAATHFQIPSAKTANAEALRDLIRFAGERSQSSRKNPQIGQDAATTKSYAEMFPGAAHIKQA